LLLVFDAIEVCCFFAVCNGYLIENFSRFRYSLLAVSCCETKFAYFKRNVNVSIKGISPKSFRDEIHAKQFIEWKAAGSAGRDPL
jgi:hypothetical protein